MGSEAFLSRQIVDTTVLGREVMKAVDAAAARIIIGAGTSSFGGAYADLTGKPTTLAGYGITDAAAASHTHLQSEVAGLTTALAAKADLVGGLVPASQLPSFVDDVLEFANLSSFPGTGEPGKIYVAVDTSRTYRWSGSAYAELTDSTAVWGSISGVLSNQTDLSAALASKSDTGHQHAASDITSGTIATERLGSGVASASTYLRGDQTWGTISASGITSLGGLTDAVQTFQAGTTGTNFEIVSAAGVHTFKLPDASATARGVVTTGAQTIAGDKTFTGILRNTGTYCRLPNGHQNYAAIQLADNGGTLSSVWGPYYDTQNSLFGWAFGRSSNTNIKISSGGINLGAGFLAWGNVWSAGTTQLWSHGDYHLSQRNGTNQQQWSLANTYTSTTSFEFFNIAWTTVVGVPIVTLQTIAGSGGGIARGMRLGASSAQLMSFWGAAPVAQPTNSVTAATRVANGGNSITDTDTFDGYTVAQIVKALRTIGVLA